MDSVADQEHIKANCPPQSDFFRKIILNQLPLSTVDLYQTYSNKFSIPKLSEYDAFFWTGGLGNIYQKNEFNWRSVSNYHWQEERGRFTRV